MQFALTLARALGLTLEGVMAMSNYEVQLWSVYLWPDTETAESADPDTSAFEALCDG